MERAELMMNTLIKRTVRKRWRLWVKQEGKHERLILSQGQYWTNKWNEQLNAYHVCDNS